MAVKAVISKLEDVAEGLRSLYKAIGNQFVLDVDGDLPETGTLKTQLSDANGRLAEFRDNNRGLNTEVTDLKSKLLQFEGIDPAEHKTLKAQAATLKDKGLKTPEDLTNVIQTAIVAATKPLQDRIDAISASEKTAREQARSSALESEITSVAAKVGVHDWALPDFMSRAKRVFVKTDDGKTLAKNGDTPLFSKDRPAEPLAIEEWATGVATEAPGLFKASNGSGAPPQGGGGGGQKNVRTIDLPAGQPLALSAADTAAMAKGELVVNRT